MSYAKAAAARGEIDDPSFHLKASRVYLYRGTKDRTYLKGSVDRVREFYANFVEDPEAQILFNKTTPSAHAWPTKVWGPPCGGGGPTRQLPTPATVASIISDIKSSENRYIDNISNSNLYKNENNSVTYTT